MQRSVIAQHIEGGDYALILVATQNDDGSRQIVPMIFCCKGCGIFAVAPQLNQWIKSGLVFQYDPQTEHGAELLKNATNEFVRQIGLKSVIAERSSVGIVARVKAQSETIDTPPAGFELNREKEPAFFWLFEKTDAAPQAMRVLKYLIAKNGIGEISDVKIHISCQADRDLIPQGFFRSVDSFGEKLAYKNGTDIYLSVPPSFRHPNSGKTITLDKPVHTLPVVCWSFRSSTSVIGGSGRFIDTDTI
jgi:hypothetical protein